MEKTKTKRARNITYEDFLTYSGGDTEMRDVVSRECEVPEFQRNYVWKKNQIEEMIDAVSLNCNSYYLGNIVIVKDDNGAGKIVDGQQRLITLSLILRTLLDYITGNNIKTKIESLIWKDNNKLVPRIEFKKDELSLAYSHVLNLQDMSSVGKIGNIQRVLYDAYSIVRRKMSEIVNKEEFFNKVLSLEFVVIRTYSEDEAYLLFEGLNSTGLTLSAVELTKNAVLGKLKDLDPSGIVKYVDIWNGIEKRFDSEKATLSWMLTFLRYQSYYTDGYVTTPNLFKKIKSTKIASKSLDSITQYLDGLDKDSEKFIKLRTVNFEKRDFNNRMNRDSWSTVNDVLFETEKLGLVQIYAIYLALWKYGESKLPNYLARGERFSEHMRKLWAFVFIVKFSDISPSTYETYFADLCQEINSATTYGDFKMLMDNFFRQRLLPIIEGVNKQKFSSRFSREVSTKRYGESFCKFILKDYLECFGIAQDNESTLEHIIPKENWDKWPNINKSFDFDCIENIGNLTLLNQTLNRDADSQGFVEKAKIYSKSTFVKNNLLGDEYGSNFTSDNPNENAVLKRGEDIGTEIFNKYIRLLQSK